MNTEVNMSAACIDIFALICPKLLRTMRFRQEDIVTGGY